MRSQPVFPHSKSARPFPFSLLDTHSASDRTLLEKVR
jgi:hypothetical protein